MVISVGSLRERGRASRFPIDAKLQDSLPPVVPGAFTEQIVSLDLDGNTEVLSKSATSNLFNSGEWTAMLWVKKTGNFTTTNENALRFHGASGFPNSFQIQQTSAVQGRADISVWNSAATERHFIRDETMWSIGAWTQVVVTHSASSSITRLYKNGSLTNSDLDTLTFAATDKSVLAIGEKFPGIFHQVAWWSAVLSADAVTQIYNSGDGSNFNLNENTGNYNESSNLVAWYRLGHDDTDNTTIGRNFATAAGVYNVTDNAVGITTADIVTDAP